MSRVFFLVAVSLIAFVLSIDDAHCEPGIMQFVAFPPERYAQALMGDHAWTIYASGDIDANASVRLDKLISAKRIPYGSLLYLSSPGGNLVGGLKLGRTIRKYGLNTYVGQIKAGGSHTEISPGFCASACAMAFLGGEYRYVPKGSVYGVHRFFWEQRTTSDADVAQIISAAVVEYIRSMGVSTDLFTLAAQAGSSELVTPPHDVLLALNVVNDGRKPVSWTIESVTGAIYLKGQQETWNGMTKLMLVCPSQGNMSLYAIFDAAQNTSEVMEFGTHWLFSDSQKIEIEDHLKTKKVLNGWINLMYAVDKPLLSTFTATQRTIGVGLSPFPGSAFFDGFADMPFQGATSKLGGFLQVCHAPLASTH